MYSSVNNHDKSSSILSRREIVGIVLVFSFLLYLLFPKSNIDTLIEDKGENTNLSINYLESMLLYYPNSIKLQMILIRNYRIAGELDKALALTNRLLTQTKDPEQLNQLYKWEYLLLKDQYFLQGDPKLLKRLKEKLYAYYQFAPKPKEYIFFFPEAAQIDFPELKYIALKGLMREQPSLIDYKFEKEFFLLASSLGKLEDSYHSISKLLKYPEAEQQIKESAIPYLLAHHDYQEASRLAHWLFLHAKNPKERQQYFEVALNTLLSDKQTKAEEIESLLADYQTKETLSKEDIHKTLTTLLAMGSTQIAAQFAIDSFERYGDEFNQSVSDLAIKSLIYNQQLQEALTISSFAYEKFDTERWLNQTIQLAQWLGESKRVIDLYTEGYHRYTNNPKYEAYLLKTSTLNSAYEILGEIYKNRVEKRDYSMVPKLAEYFEYCGEIQEAEEYFVKLLQRSPNKTLHYYAIIATYNNNDFKKGLSLYQDYQRRYGIDPKLQQISIKKLIALKRYHQAYLFSKALPLNNKETLDMAWMEKDYAQLYTMLWQLEEKGQLPEYHYSTLVKLEKEINQSKKIDNLYQKAWEKTHHPSYLYGLLYDLMQTQSYQKIHALLDRLPNRYLLEKELTFQTIMANYFIKIGKKDQALNAFKKAFALDKNNPNTHQAYLWFLLDAGLNRPLIKELSLLRKDPKLQQSVGFASVVAALQLQQSDLALRWLTPLRQANNKIEYQILYADILEHQDRTEGATKIRRSLFRKLYQMIDKDPKLLKDKAFARTYLQLLFRYATPIERGANYLTSFKRLFSPSEYHDLEVGYHTLMQHPNRVRYLKSKYHLDIPWLNLYLAMSLNDQSAKQRLLQQENERLPLQDRIVALRDIGDQAGAFSTAFEGLERNRRDTKLYQLFHEMVRSNLPQGDSHITYQHLNKNCSLKSKEIKYRWQLYPDLFMGVALQDDHYSNQDQKSLAITLSNQHHNLLWQATLEQHQSDEDFVGAKMALSYQFNHFLVALDTQYHTQTTLSPKLQSQGMASHWRISLNHALSSHLQMGIEHQQSYYKLHNRSPIGESQSTQLLLNYTLRSGYPDLRFSTHLSTHDYEAFIANFLPKNFTEFGLNMLIGERQKEAHYQGWRPFGGIGLAINNHQDLGTSLSFGIGNTLKGDDNLRLIFNYTQGIKMISDPSYGVKLEYQF